MRTINHYTVYIRVVLAAALMVVLWVSASLDPESIPTQGAEAALLAPAVVIDAGHGGYDGGAQYDGVVEKDVNLGITEQLREILLATGHRVTLTRYGDYSLIEQEQTNTRKREDMIRRLSVIEAHQPDLIISVHCNAINSPLWSGSQVFYQEGFDQGKLLAQDIQFYLHHFTDTTRGIAHSDFYLLRESSIVGGLLEAGFLSHPQERKLLQQPSYQRRLAVATWLGIERYLYYPRGHDMEGAD